MQLHKGLIAFVANRDEGWGGINLGSLFGAPPEMVVDQAEVFTEAGQEVAYELEVTDRGPLRVTLAWSDAPGGFGADPRWSTTWTSGWSGWGSPATWSPAGAATVSRTYLEETPIVSTT